MEFESRKSLLYIVFSGGVFVVSVYFVRGYAAVASPEIVIAGVPVMAYLLSRFTDGGDGEILLHGNKIADRRFMILIGLMNLNLALTLLLWAYIGLLGETAQVIDQFIVGLVSGIVAAPVTLLLARPYGIIEDVARELVSSIRN